MRIAFADLKLTRLDVVHAGKATLSLGQGIRALAVHDLVSGLPDLSRL